MPIPRSVLQHPQQARPVRHARTTVPLGAPPRASEVCLELEDHSIARYSATKFFQLRGLRDPQAQAARMAQQFVTQNRSLISLLDVQIDTQFDGTDVQLVIQAGSAVGAIPLL